MIDAYGVTHPNCNYLAPLGGVCTKCGWVDTTRQAMSAETARIDWIAKHINSQDFDEVFGWKTFTPETFRTLVDRCMAENWE